MMAVRWANQRPVSPKQPLEDPFSLVESEADCRGIYPIDEIYDFLEIDSKTIQDSVSNVGGEARAAGPLDSWAYNQMFICQRIQVKFPKGLLA
jgi:hypothetical protein